MAEPQTRNCRQLAGQKNTISIMW